MSYLILLKIFSDILIVILVPFPLSELQINFTGPSRYAWVHFTELAAQQNCWSFAKPDSSSRMADRSPNTTEGKDFPPLTFVDKVNRANIQCCNHPRFTSQTHFYLTS